MKISKILVDRKGRRYYWKKGDLNSLFGIVKEKDILENNGIVKSHIGKEFICFDAGFSDQLEKIKRGPAIMIPKDIGVIISYTGINKESKILEAGTGCGVLTSFLARISDYVVSYEKDKNAIETAKENFKSLEIENVEIKNKDIYEGIEEKNLDLIVLDLLEAWKVVKYSYESLKSGGFLVCYLPQITQVIELVKEIQKYNFVKEKVIELIEREWEFEEKKARPKSRMIGHTGFLCFFRKY